MSHWAGAFARRRLLLAAACGVIVILAAVPSGIGFSTGIHGGMSGVPPGFANNGCTECHGGGSTTPHDFGPNGADVISISIMDADGGLLAGPYGHEAEYTITIGLDEMSGIGQPNRAGFNLRLSEGGGSLAGVDGVSQASDDGLQATHVDASMVEWQVLWTAPAGGPIVFDLWVNDVDGSGAPDAGDHVYNRVFGIADVHGGERHIPGAAEEEEPHVGVPLPQYWLGLIALAGMLLIIVFGFFYLKFVSPHNTDKGDR